MLNNTLLLNTLGLVAAARQLSGDILNQQMLNAYIGYAATFNKNYESTGDFTERLGQYMNNDEYIEECNWKADHSSEDDPVHCAHNIFSDWTVDEYEAMLGFVDNGDADSDEGQEVPTVGIAMATTVDHTPNMTGVKS
jgi:hypothetical protein